MTRVLKNWITSLMGLLIMGVALYLFIGHKYGVVEYGVTMLEFITMITLGYVFLMAKDSLITGLLMNILKVKPKDEPPASEK